MTRLKPARDLARLRICGIPGESAAYTLVRKALLTERVAPRRHPTRITDMRQARPIRGRIRAGWTSPPCRACSA